MSLGLPTWLAILAAGPPAAVAALLIGPIVLWLRGAYFIIVTLSFFDRVAACHRQLGRCHQWRHGNSVNSLSCDRFFRFSSKTSYFYLVVSSAVVTIWCIRRLINSRTGRAFEALRENENVAMSINVSKLHYWLLAFCIGAGKFPCSPSEFPCYALGISLFRSKGNFALAH